MQKSLLVICYVGKFNTTISQTENTSVYHLREQQNIWTKSCYKMKTTLVAFLIEIFHEKIINAEGNIVYLLE